MQTFIALLRGINVGGHKKVPMAELRSLLTKKGFQKVQTYIQSGNVVLQSGEKAKDIATIMQTAILEYFGFEVTVIIKTHAELQTILNGCPFSTDKKEKAYFIMLNKIPDANLVKEVEMISYENEEVIIIKDALYFHSSAGYGNAKFSMNLYERKLNVIGTARNYNTMLKLLSLTAEH